MKAKPISAKVDENGKITDGIHAVKSTLKLFAGKHITIEIKRKFNRRSTLQNGYYWSILVPFFQLLFKVKCGDILSLDDTHAILKTVCNYKEYYNESTGEVLKFPQSTKELSTKEWMEYEERLRLFSLDFFGEDLPERM